MFFKLIVQSDLLLYLTIGKARFCFIKSDHHLQIPIKLAANLSKASINYIDRIEKEKKFRKEISNYWSVIYEYRTSNTMSIGSFPLTEATIGNWLRKL